MMVWTEDIRCGERVLCRGIDLRLDGGECVLLCGANGSGKTTLLNTLARTFPDRIALVPTGIPKVKGFTLRDFIATACYRMTRWDGAAGPELTRLSEQAMEQLGIRAESKRDISTLSDGEFQKACIAAVLCTRRPILLLDEPTSFLDPENRISVLRCLRSLADEGRSIVFSSHDTDSSLKFCNRVWAIGRDGLMHCAAEQSSGSKEDLEKAVREIFSENAYL